MVAPAAPPPVRRAAPPTVQVSPPIDKKEAKKLCVAGKDLMKNDAGALAVRASQAAALLVAAKTPEAWTGTSPGKLVQVTLLTDGEGSLEAVPRLTPDGAEAFVLTQALCREAGEAAPESGILNPAPLIKAKMDQDAPAAPSVPTAPSPAPQGSTV